MAGPIFPGVREGLIRGRWRAVMDDANALAVWFFYREHADRDGIAWASNATMQYALGKSESSIRRGRAKLIEAGLIRRTGRRPRHCTEIQITGQCVDRLLPVNQVDRFEKSKPVTTDLKPVSERAKPVSQGDRRTQRTQRRAAAAAKTPSPHGRAHARARSDTGDNGQSCGTTHQHDADAAADAACAAAADSCVGRGEQSDEALGRTLETLVGASVGVTRRGARQLVRQHPDITPDDVRHAIASVEAQPNVRNPGGLVIAKLADGVRAPRNNFRTFKQLCAAINERNNPVIRVRNQPWIALNGRKCRYRDDALVLDDRIIAHRNDLNQVEIRENTYTRLSSEKPDSEASD